MLYRTHGLAADELLGDLLRVRETLATNWLKGGFVSGQSHCIVAAVNATAGVDPNHYTTVREDQVTDPRLVRAGRMIAQIYTAIYGPEAPTDITVSAASGRIARFNDHPTVTKEAVLLAVDRAVAELLAPPVVG